LVIGDNLKSQLYQVRSPEQRGKIVQKKLIKKISSA
jgi:hypothetical protein